MQDSLISDSDDGRYWAGSLGIAVGGGRQVEVDISYDMLEVVRVVLSTSRWVQVEHTNVDIEHWGKDV